MRERISTYFSLTYKYIEVDMETKFIYFSFIYKHNRVQKSGLLRWLSSTLDRRLVQDSPGPRRIPKTDRTRRLIDLSLITHLV